MIPLLLHLLAVLFAPLRSKGSLLAENLLLRHQVLILRRKVKGRVPLTNGDRWFLVQLYRWFPLITGALVVIKPETLIRWHRAGFRLYWRWKSHSQGGRPRVCPGLRALIRQISLENPLWGAPRLHGELLKLGFDVAQSSVAKYMARHRRSPNRGWRIFVRNHAPEIAAMNLFVVPTIGFNLLYAFIIIRLDRRHLVWINVTANPTAESAKHFRGMKRPKNLIRDRDGIYGTVVIRRLQAMGIRDRPIAAASPWQNGYAERLIGTIRRECLDHVIVLGEAHLRRLLQSYAHYYNATRPHWSLAKDAPLYRKIERDGRIASRAILGGLHNRYLRI